MKKIISTLLLAVAAILTSFAQDTPNTLVVTFKDGTNAQYRIATIDNLSFIKGETAIPELTTGPYAVGDYYYDGSAEGVVVEVDKTGSYGKIAAMTDMSEDLAWSTLQDITGAQDVNDGLINMATVAALSPAYAEYPAFKACADLGEGWYLPAQKELQSLRGILDAVNATLGARGFDPISADSFYWSSTEADQFSDAMAFGADMDMPGMFGVDKAVPCKVRAFKYFGEEPVKKYQVGAYIEEDGKKGIIYWVSKDETYAKIIALTESKASWGELNKATGASSDYDGEKNLAAVRKADESLAAYPAFSACTSLGDGWYLPALNELNAISNIAGLLNTSLQQNSGTPLTWTYYWSSTEYPSDAANTAYSVSFADDQLAPLGSSKSVERSVRAIAYVGERPVVEPTYAIGDAYMEGDEVIGIVCEISEDGKHGKIIALKNATETGRINAMWDKRANSDNYINIGADDTADGSVNMAAAKANDPELTSLPVFRVCADLGEGWYPGATDELLNIYNNKAVLDAALKANGGSALDKDDYWTSTQGSENPLERATAVSLKDGSKFDYRKYFYQKVRPMKKF